MRHIVQRYLAQPSRNQRQGFFGYSPKVVTSLVNVAVALHNRKEHIIRGFSSIVAEDFHNDILVFLGYQDTPILLNEDYDLHISVGFPSEDIVIKVVRQKDEVLRTIVVKREDTPYARAIEGEKAYFYTDNPLVIMLGMFAAYRNQQLLSITTAPFGVGRWNQRTFYRLFVEAFNMVCTHEAKGFDQSSRQFFDVEEDINEISSSHGRAGIREGVVKACYGHSDIIVDFRYLGLNGDCFFCVGHGSNAGTEGSLGMGMVRVPEVKHKVAMWMYKFNAKNKHFSLSEDFFKQGTKFNKDSDLNLYLPPQMFATTLDRHRIQFSSFHWLNQVMTIAGARQLEKLFTGQFMETPMRYEGTPGIVDWYMNSSNDSFVDVFSGVLMLESFVLVDGSRITWTLRIIDTANFTEIGKVVFDPSEFITLSEKPDEDGEVWLVRHSFVKELMMSGFSRLLNDTLDRIVRTRPAKVAIYSPEPIEPEFFRMAANVKEPLICRMGEVVYDVDAIVVVMENRRKLLTDRNATNEDIRQAVNVKFMKQGKALSADELAVRRCNSL